MLHTQPQDHWPFGSGWRRFLRGFTIIMWASRPSWSSDPDPANKLLFPHPTEAPHEIRLRLTQRFWRRRSLKMVDGRTTDDNGQRTDDGACLYYKLTNEPKRTGELKRRRKKTSQNKRRLHRGWKPDPPASEAKPFPLDHSGQLQLPVKKTALKEIRATHKPESLFSQTGTQNQLAKIAITLEPFKIAIWKLSLSKCLS